MVKNVFFIVFVLLMGKGAYAQSYRLADLEVQFLKNNYALMAQRYGIQRADAELIQERVWSNPTLTVNEVNLWTNPNYEELSRLIGNYGKGQQIAVELEQLIETAGKRTKRVAIKQSEKDGEILAYEELQRQLKLELRQAFYSVERVQAEMMQLQKVLDLYEELDKQYTVQSEKKNISKADSYRVQSELVVLQQEYSQLNDEKEEGLHMLRVLTQLPNLTAAELIMEGASAFVPHTLPSDLLQQAMSQNIGLKKQDNLKQSADRKLNLEKAMAKPDMRLQLGYDRGGSIMRDFIGVGVQVDLPVFNRNKGNIKAAQFEVEQQKTMVQGLRKELESQLLRLQKQLSNYHATLVRWDMQPENEQDTIWGNYYKYLQNRQVTLLEFIDFTQAYKERHKSRAALLQRYKDTYEELQYIVGFDF